MRWFWRLYAPAATGAAMWMAAQVVGPYAELRLHPVRVDQRIENIVRRPNEVCWDWLSEKVRPASAYNMDVFLETPRDRYITSVYDAVTKEPWSRKHAVPIGPRVQSYCVQIPPSARPTEPMTVFQRVYYPGWLNLWPLPVDLPDVHAPPSP